MPDSRDVARRAFESLQGHGTATRETVSQISVGLGEYLDAFAARYLGEKGMGICKLLLGSNGEGKTHLLFSVRARALELGHLVAVVEARNAGASASAFEFGRELLRSIETPGTDAVDPDEKRLLVLLRESLRRKRESLREEVLDPEIILPEWIEGLRTRDLSPGELAQGIADGLRGLHEGDLRAAVTAVEQFGLEKVHVSASTVRQQGPHLLRSILRLPRLLGFRPLVLLVDEAELAVEGASRKRRLAFLAFLRFINDHLGAAREDGAVVLIACTDDFWPARLAEYTALKGRMADPGYDSLDERRDLTTKRLVNKNKLWIRETFRGVEEDYRRLGAEVVRLAALALSGVDETVQHANSEILAKIASSNEVIRWIKRPFVKALAQCIADQVDEPAQRVLSEEETRARFDLARKSILQLDGGDT